MATVGDVRKLGSFGLVGRHRSWDCMAMRELKLVRRLAQERGRLAG